MKKSKLKMGLITSFICGIALTACDVTANDKYVVTYKDYSGNELGLLIDNMYSEDMDTSAGLTKYYQKVRDLLVRASFSKVTKDSVNGLTVKTPYETLIAQAENKVEEQKENARKNAKNNDTSYSDELDAIFESHECEDEEGLKEHFLLELEQEQLDSAIMNNEAQLKILRDGNGASEKGWIKSAKPYHIKHMLVKVEGGASDFTRATITKDEAEKMAKVVTLLGAGSSFDDLASNNLLNDDSSDKLGDVGIVNNNATTKSLKMVSEFQLGIYTADVKVNGRAGDGIGLDAMVDVDGTGDVKVEDIIDVVEVPYAAFKKIGEVAKYPEDTEDTKIKEVNTCVYPRNVLWNKYFNNHNVFVISNKEANTAGTDTLVGSSVDANAPADAFNDAGYLTDVDGKVIFGVRSEYGIHFIKIQKSPYEENLDKYYPVALKVDGKDVTDVAEYGESYITGLDNKKGTFDTRLSDIKSAIKSYDSNSEYRLYNFLVSYAKSNGLISTSDEKTNALLKKIDDHIADLKASETYKQEEGIKSVWENYLRMVELQNRNRAASWTDSYFYTKYVEGNPVTVYVENTGRTALVPETTGDAFEALCTAENNTVKATALANFVEGGQYYYGK